MPTIKVGITSDEVDRDECTNCDSKREDESGRAPVGL